MSSKCASRKRRAARRPLRVQHLEEIEVGVEPARRRQLLAPKPSSAMRCTLMRRYSPGAGAARQRALVDQPADELDGAEFGHQRGVERDLVDAVHDLVATSAASLPRSSGLICTTSTSSVCGGAEERKDRRIADVAAVPIGHAVDLDRAEHRAAGRPRPSPRRRSILSRGNTRSRPVCTLVAEMNSCRSWPGAHRVEIDEALDQVLQRIDVERVEIVGRQIARQRLDPGLHRRASIGRQREQPVDHARAARRADCRRGSPRARNRRAACAPPPVRRARAHRPA